MKWGEVVGDNGVLGKLLEQPLEQTAQWVNQWATEQLLTGAVSGPLHK